MEDRGELDLTLLLDQHQKEVWEYKKKESQWIRDKNQLDGNKKIIEELSIKMVELGKVNLALKKRVEEAEGETILVKGIGMNSPEMRAAQAKIKELEANISSAQGINDDHQRYNGKLQTQLSEALGDNKKLAMQIADMNSRKK